MRTVLIVPALLSVLAVPLVLTGCAPSAQERAQAAAADEAQKRGEDLLRKVKDADDDAFYFALLGAKVPEFGYEWTSEVRPSAALDRMHRFPREVLDTNPAYAVQSVLRETFLSSAKCDYTKSPEFSWVDARIFQNEKSQSTSYAAFVSRCAKKSREATDGLAHARQNAEKAAEAQKRADAEAEKNKADAALNAELIKLPVQSVLDPVLADFAENGIRLKEPVVPSAWTKLELSPIDATGVYVDGDFVLVYGKTGSAFTTNSGENWTSANAGSQFAWIHAGKGYGLSLDNEIRSWDGYSYSAVLDLPTIYNVINIGDYIFAKSKTKVFILSYNEDGSLVIKNKIDSTENQRLACAMGDGSPTVEIYDFDRNEVRNIRHDGTSESFGMHSSMLHIEKEIGFRVSPDSCKNSLNYCGDMSQFGHIRSSYGAFPIGPIWFFNNQGIMVSLSNEVQVLAGWRDKKITTCTIFLKNQPHPASKSIPDGTRAVGANDKRLFAVGKDGIWITDRN